VAILTDGSVDEIEDSVPTDDQAMKVLIQDRRTLLYFKDIYAWTHHARDGFDFRSPKAAAEFCRANKFAETDVVLKFDTGRQELRVPVWPVHSTATVPAEI